jgi:hypothetical protein
MLRSDPRDNVSTPQGEKSSVGFDRAVGRRARSAALALPSGPSVAMVAANVTYPWSLTRLAQLLD